MSKPTPLFRDLVAKLGEDAREFFEERAAVREFDGGYPRERAECLALIDTLHRDPLALAGVTVLRVRRDDTWVYVLAADGDAALRELTARGYVVLGAVDPRTVIHEFDRVAVLTRLR